LKDALEVVISIDLLLGFEFAILWKGLRKPKNFRIPELFLKKWPVRFGLLLLATYITPEIRSLIIE
jgi:hypothetical protein